jgi:hypothetical protein
VLAERHGTSARAAFETMRRDARSQGRPVAEVARAVLADLTPEGEADEAPRAPRSVPAPGGRRPGTIVAAVSPPEPRLPHEPDGHSVAAADGRS